MRCVHCGGVAQPIMKRKTIEPYWVMFPSFLKAIFSLNGLLQIFSVSVVMFLFSLVPLIGGLLAGGVYAGYFFVVIRHTAFGGEDLPEPADFTDVFDSILAPLVRLILATAVLWVPALLYIHHHTGFSTFMSDPGSHIRDPILVVILLLSVLYFPGAIITAAITESTLAMLNPMVILGIALRIPGQYLVTTVAWAFMVAADGFLGGLAARALAPHAIPVVTPLLLHAIGLVIPMLTAFMLGRLIHQNGSTLGFTRQRDLMVPEWAGATPAGRLPVAGFEAAGAARPVHPEPIALEPEPENAERSLDALLKAGDNQASLELYRRMKMEGAEPELDPACELRLANLLERAGMSVDAALACRRAAHRDLNGPLATRAIFTAARLLVERVGNREQGIAMYHYLIDNYPEDPMVDRAREMLRRLEAGAGSGVP